MSETMMKGRAEGSSVAPAGGSASGRATAVQTPTDAVAWWQQHDQRVYQCIKLWVEQWWESQQRGLLDAVGQVFGEHRASVREALTNLKERVIRLEATSNFEERFTKFADEVKREPEIPQSELLAKIEGLQRQMDGNRVADLDTRFRELAERVGELEKTNSLEARFTKFANEAKRGSEIPQDELLAKIEDLQRQVDKPNRVADLDTRFRELAERVGELEKTNSLEARFTKLANAAKGGPEIQQSELLAKIEGLQRQLDELKRVAAQPGPQGPPGPPGKLQRVKDYVAECVCYEGDVVTHTGALWQARGDTVHAPPHSDWVCLARAGRDGLTPTIRGTYDISKNYEQLDVVAMDGASFIARHDNPGICPGGGWQLMSRQGRPGRKGETGERGPRGEKGETGLPAVVPQFVGSRINENYELVRVMSDGTKEVMALLPAFERFLNEVSS